MSATVLDRPSGLRADAGARASRPGDRRALAAAMLFAAAIALAAALAGSGVRSTVGGQAAVDEPQYLLTALSLWHDRDLDISDELASGQWRAYHQAELPQQTQPLADGRALSPHDPLLPLLLAAPVGLFGLAGAKVALALVSAAAAALTVWTAVRRFAVPGALAAMGAALAFASPPLVVYAQQVYPEIPAALATLVAVAALTGPLRRAGIVTVAVAVTALPWLGVKYAPVAAVLAVLALLRLLAPWQLRREGRAAVLLASALALSAAAYLAVHRLVWGGWTVYASGDQFAATGEFSVMGVDPDYVGRSLRIVALLVDRGFGIAAWSPVWLLVVPALGAGLASRNMVRRNASLVFPLLAGWATATWVALTMHGFWWPGRQVVVVLPLAVLLVLGWLAQRGRVARVAAGVAATAGVATYAALVVGGEAGRLTWVSGRELVTGAPLFSWLQPLWPDYRVLSAPGAHPGQLAGHLIWSLVLALVLLVSIVRTRQRITTPEVSP